MGTRRSDQLLVLVALFSIVLMQGSKLLSHGTSLKIVLFVPFLLAIGATSAQVVKPRHRPSRKAVLALWVYLAVTVIAVVRGVESGGSNESTRSALELCAQLLVLAWFSYRLLASARTDQQRWERLVALALAPAVFVGFNLLIMKVHLPLITVPTEAKGSANGTTATVLASLGIHASRSNLPLTNGVNASGSISACGFAAAAILALRCHDLLRLTAICAAGVCAYATLLSDSHTAMIIALIIVLLFAVRPRARQFSWVPVATAVSPLIILGCVKALSSLGLAFIARGSTEKLENLDDRLYIWRPAWHAVTRSDLYHLLVGYGAYGQVTSGASRGYAWLFEGVTEAPFRNTVHDLPLQTLLDTGVVGLLALVLLGVAVFSALSRVAEQAISPPIQALSAIVIVILLNGATEALPSYLFPECLAAVLLVAGGALALAPTAVVAPARTRRWTVFEDRSVSRLRLQTARRS